MKNRQSAIFGILAVTLIGALVATGCGSTSAPEPTPTVPRLEAYKLLEVCRSAGEGVPEAAAYAQASGSHPIVYAYGSQSRDYILVSEVDYFAPPVQWQPNEPAAAELVACIWTTEKTIEECPYTLSNGLKATVYRVQQQAVVRLRESQTGKMVATSDTMLGSVPDWCGESESFPTGSYSKTNRGKLPADAIHAWLRQYVEIP